MTRRFHVHQLRTGFLDLDTAEAHHVRDVLRLAEGTVLELFDDNGQTATGPLVMVNPSVVRVEITSIAVRSEQTLHLTVASAVPKGDRADWMIEKLSELGVSRFIPLATERSVVLPTGRNKIERWERIALESAKQSHRAGVMKIAELTVVASAIKDAGTTWYLSTASDAVGISQAIESIVQSQQMVLLVGPEGGWTEEESQTFLDAGFTGVGLTRSVLRVETAAITAAAILLCLRQ